MPFIFEYLMEHLETKAALRDPDVFLTNPVAPSMADKARWFAFDKALQPALVRSAVADDIKEAEGRMRVGELMALPVLAAQVEQLCQCQWVCVSDHHHAANLVKLWLLRMPSPLVPLYAYGTNLDFLILENQDFGSEIKIS